MIQRKRGGHEKEQRRIRGRSREGPEKEQRRSREGAEKITGGTREGQEKEIGRQYAEGSRMINQAGPWPLLAN